MASRLKTRLGQLTPLAPLRDRVVRRRELHQSCTERLNRQAARITAIQKKLDSWSLASSRSRVEYTAAAHQINALEERLAALEAAGTDPGDDPARAEARGIVDEVRLEHARVRARLTLVGAYEERLRRVEAALLYAIKLEQLPGPPEETVGADVIEARRNGRIAPDATALRAARAKKLLKR